MVSPISNSESTIFLMNIYYDFFFHWQTEEKKPFGPIRNLVYHSTAQTQKNSWITLVKTSDEFINSIETAENNDSIYIMANDPDADRLAIAERVQDKWAVHHMDGFTKKRFTNLFSFFKNFINVFFYPNMLDLCLVPLQVPI